MKKARWAGLFCIIGSKLFCCHSFFLDTGALAAALALEVEFGAANAAHFVQIEGLDVGGEEGEGSFYAYAVGYFTNGEGGSLALALAFDHVSFKALDTLFVAFDDLIVDGDIVTGFEFRKFFFSRQLLVYKSYSSVHNSNFCEPGGSSFKGWQKYVNFE